MRHPSRENPDQQLRSLLRRLDRDPARTIRPGDNPGRSPPRLQPHRHPLVPARQTIYRPRSRPHFQLAGHALPPRRHPGQFTDLPTSHLITKHHPPFVHMQPPEPEMPPSTLISSPRGIHRPADPVHILVKHLPTRHDRPTTLVARVVGLSGVGNPTPPDPAHRKTRRIITDDLLPRQVHDQRLLRGVLDIRRVLVPDRPVGHRVLQERPVNHPRSPTPIDHPGGHLHPVLPLLLCDPIRIRPLVQSFVIALSWFEILPRVALPDNLLPQVMNHLVTLPRSQHPVPPEHQSIPVTDRLPE